MKPTRKLLRASAGLAARLLIADRLKEAAHACQRLRQPGAAEALHDFRVSVRRLRTGLRAYQDHLDKSLAKRLRRKLGDLTDRTNAGRDEEVHLQWLRRCLKQPQLPDLEQTGIRLMLHLLEARRRHQQPRLIRDIMRDFERIAARLRKRIKRGRRASQRRHPARQPAFATVTAAILRGEAGNLHRQLRRIGSVNSPNPAHQARLIAKRMRYLLEPVSPKLVGASAAVARLRQLQDKLGELHDLQTLKAEVSAAVEHTAGDWSAQLIRDADSEIWMAAIDRKLPQVQTCYALVAVTAHIHAEQRRLFESLRRTWLEGRDAVFQKQVQRLVERLLAFETRVGEA